MQEMQDKLKREATQALQVKEKEKLLIYKL